MKLVVTVLARDEADVIDAQVAFHLNAGADFVIATDNNSRDGTTEILERYAAEGCLHLIHEPAEGLRQGQWVTRMARLAAREYGADWVINTDADEFWWPRGGSVKEVLAAVPARYGVVEAFWRSFVPRPDDGSFFAERMTARLSQQAPINDPTSFYRPVIKVAHRGDPNVTVARGNHALASSSFVTLPNWHPIEVLHFPLRSRAQWARKVELQGDAFTKHIERSGTGYHLQGYDALQRGRIEQQHDSLVVDDHALEVGLRDGSLIVDNRLRDALRMLRADVDGRAFALPSERNAGLSFPMPDAADEIAYAAEAASLDESYAVRVQRQLDTLERRLLSLETMTLIVGSLLVRNEDVFVARAVRNVAGFCDRIHAVDHVSSDRTWPILQSLAQELDNLDVRRSRSSAVAHRLLEPYAGTDTWVIGVDGDELYDPLGLARLREELLRGVHGDVFRVKAHVLNCDELDERSATASGWLAPPSRPVTKLFNFAAVDSWTGSPDPLQSGDVAFRPGFHWESRRDLADATTWETDPLRCVHVCFLRRSSRETDAAHAGRTNLDESREFDRSTVGTLKRFVRRPRPAPRVAELARQGKNWKREWYARGERVTVDATAFLRGTRTESLSG